MRHGGSRLRRQHAAQCRAIFQGQGGENRREVHRGESPLRHQGERPGPTQKVADLRRAKACVDMNGKRTKPRAGKDCGQIIGPIRQPQRNVSAGTNARFAQPRGKTQDAVLEGAPVHCASGIGHRWSRGVELGPRHQRTQRAWIFRSIGLPHQRHPISQSAGHRLCLSVRGTVGPLVTQRRHWPRTRQA